MSWKSNSMHYAIYALTLDWSKFTMSFIFSPIQFVGLSHPESCQRVQPEHSYSFFSSLDDSTMVFSRLQMLIKRDPQIASSASNSQSSTRRRPETGFFWVNITNQFCQSYPSNVANIIVTYLRESTKKKTVWAVFERLS